MTQAPHVHENNDQIDQQNEVILKLNNSKKYNKKNCFDMPMPNLQAVHGKDQINDEDFRKTTVLLGIKSDILGLRSANFKDLTDNVIKMNNEEALKNARKTIIDPSAARVAFTHEFFHGKKSLRKDADIEMDKLELEVDKDPLFLLTSS